MPDFANPINPALQGANPFENDAPEIRRQRNQSLTAISVDPLEERSAARSTERRQDDDPLRNDDGHLTAREVVKRLREAREENATQRRRAEDNTIGQPDAVGSRDRARLFSDENLTLNADSIGVSRDDAQLLGALDRQPLNSNIRPGATVANEDSANTTRADLPPVNVFSQPEQRSATDRLDRNRVRNIRADLPPITPTPVSVLTRSRPDREATGETGYRDQPETPVAPTPVTQAQPVAKRQPVPSPQQDIPPASVARDRQPLDLALSNILPTPAQIVPAQTAPAQITQTADTAETSEAEQIPQQNIRLALFQRETTQNSDPVRSRVEESNPRSNEEGQRQAIERSVEREIREASGQPAVNQLEEIRQSNPGQDFDVQPVPEPSELTPRQRESLDGDAIINLPSTPGAENRVDQRLNEPETNRQVERNIDPQSVTALTRAREASVPPSGLPNISRDEPTPQNGFALPNEIESNRQAATISPENQTPEAVVSQNTTPQNQVASSAAPDVRPPVQITLNTQDNPTAREAAPVNIGFGPDRSLSVSNTDVRVDAENNTRQPGAPDITISTRISPVQTQTNSDDSQSLGESGDQQRQDVRLRLIERETLPVAAADTADAIDEDAPGNPAVASDGSGTVQTTVSTAQQPDNTPIVIRPRADLASADNVPESRTEQDQATIVTANNTIQENAQLLQERRDRDPDSADGTQQPEGNSVSVSSLGGSAANNVLEQVANA